LYVDRSAPHLASRLELAYDAERPEVSSRVGENFETSQLAPPGLLFTDKRATVILEPLFFEREQLGIINLVMGPEEGVIYEAIRDQVSGAIRGAWLVTQVVEEGKRRQALEKEQADNEMRIAANIQTMILPHAQEILNLDIAASMVPAVNVGGDYYDIHPTSDGCWLGIGDVVGHGLRSGLIMLMLQSAVSGLIKSGQLTTPRQVICTRMPSCTKTLGPDSNTTSTRRCACLNTKLTAEFNLLEPMRRYWSTEPGRSGANG